MENRKTLDRASVIANNFFHKVTTDHLPLSFQFASTQLTLTELQDLFLAQCLSRHLDLQARILKAQNKCYYTIGSSGHEANAAIGKVFDKKDMAFLHYRSGAFVIARAMAAGEKNIVDDLVLSLLSAASDPISAGRHKVFGSKSLNIPPQTSTIASHLPKAVGTAFSINLAHELNIERELADDSVVLCSFGDGSFNHSTAQGALNLTQWIKQASYPLPLVFICEDNHWAISVATPQDWIEQSIASRRGWHYVTANGLDIGDVYEKSLQAEQLARYKKQPVFFHLKTVRLMGHAGSDVEMQYRSIEQIEQTEAQDPLLYTAAKLRQAGMSSQDVLAIYQQAQQQVVDACERHGNEKQLADCQSIMQSIIPSQHKSANQSTLQQKIYPDRNLAQQINHALQDILQQYPQALVFGEDVGKKGGVYHVTADLQSQFGQRRVFDTLLDEQSILGTAIGLAHNGFIPIAEIQFLAYVHNAEDQIRGEAATLSFFSNGQFTNPMVIRIPGLAYQKGFGGHFHNDNSLAIFRDIPGLIVLCPSNGRDAACLLKRAVALAYEQRRVVIFIEPIALYMTKDLHQAGDNLWLSSYDSTAQIAQGEMGCYGEGEDCLLLSYGNGYYLSRQAEKLLSQQNIHCTLLDLRWLAPLPDNEILARAKHFKKIVIVDECRKTGSLSETLVTLLYEKLPKTPRIKRVYAQDCFIPLGESWQHVLPSVKQIVQSVQALMNEQ